MPQAGPSRGNTIQDYVTVAERIEAFYRKFPDGRIITHIVEHDAERGFILIRAEIYRNADDALPAATGHAYELKTEGYVQRTSYIEVGETSAVGRALAMAGFEVKRGIASREEVEGARRKENSSQRSPSQSTAPSDRTAHTQQNNSQKSPEPGDWACSPEKRDKVINLRNTLKERWGLSEQALDEDLRENFAPGDVKAMSDQMINKYIAHLAGMATECAKRAKAGQQQ